MSKYSKYSKKTDIMEATWEYHSGIMITIVILIACMIFFCIGWIEENVFGFSIMSFIDADKESGTAIGRALIMGITGFLTIVVVMAAYRLTIFHILKQAAIVRYCRLPLTKEEIELGIQSRDFDSMKSYLDYIERQLRYSFTCHLSLTEQEVVDIITNGNTVWPLKDNEYYALPEFLCDNLGTQLEYVNKDGHKDILCLPDRAILMNNKLQAEKHGKIPETDTYWGVYARNYFAALSE